jgi:hypothetical protein
MCGLSLRRYRRSTRIGSCSGTSGAAPFASAPGFLVYPQSTTPLYVRITNRLPSKPLYTEPIPRLNTLRLWLDVHAILVRLSRTCVVRTTHHHHHHDKSDSRNVHYTYLEYCPEGISRSSEGRYWQGDVPCNGKPSPGLFWLRSYDLNIG